MLGIRSTSGATRASLSPLTTGMQKANSTYQDAVTACLDEIHLRLAEATQIAKAAQACAHAGSIAEAVTLSMDIEQLIYEAGRLHDAASLLNRFTQE